MKASSWNGWKTDENDVTGRSRESRQWRAEGGAGGGAWPPGASLGGGGGPPSVYGLIVKRKLGLGK